MKRMIMALAALLLMAGAAATAAAAPEEMDRPPSKEQTEKVRQRIEALRIWKLTKALDVDEKTSAVLFPLLNRFDKRRHEQEQSLRDGMKALRDSVREGREPAIRVILDRLEQGRRNVQKINDEERGELKKLLTVRQQAAFVLFQQEFRQEIGRIIEESRGRRLQRALDRERPDMRGRPEMPERPFPPDRE